MDLGLARSVKGSVLYAALKGATESGLNVPHSKDILPEEKRIASKEGFDIIDLSLTLKASYFSWRTDLKGDFSPNEHLIDKGRLFVANKLKEKIDFIFDGGLH